MIVLKGKTEAELGAIMARCHIAGLKEAETIVSGYIGMEAGKFQVVGAGAIRRAISARISELEGQSNG